MEKRVGARGAKNSPGRPCRRGVSSLFSRLEGIIGAMQEIELKFQVPAASRAAVGEAVAGAGASPRLRLRAAYFDTPDRALAQAGMALRVRREGRKTVQTLKGLGDDGLTRAEHNVSLPAGSGEGVDPALHAATEVGQRLLALLVRSPPLVETFRTDIRRRTRQLRNRWGLVELAFDEGVIVAGDRELAVCELEIELVRGSPLAVPAAAHGWVKRHAVWLDTRSKAERGDMLARGEPMAPPRKAGEVVLPKGANAEQALRRVLLSCLDQIAVNASQVASGAHDDEHVHQWRIGLRRLRSALQLFDVQEAMPALSAQAMALFRALGVARDRAALGEAIAGELDAAMHGCGLDLRPPRLVPMQGIPPAELARSGAAQELLLGLYEWTQAPEGTTEVDAASLLEKKLRRLDRKLVAGLRDFRGLDAAQRHRLRKRGKRLRYGLEFAQSLLAERATRRHLRKLKSALDLLGRYMDLTVAIDACRASDDADPARLFALGWLAARREAVVDETPALARKLKRAPRTGKRKS